MQARLRHGWQEGYASSRSRERTNTTFVLRLFFCSSLFSPALAFPFMNVFLSKQEHNSVCFTPYVKMNIASATHNVINEASNGVSARLLFTEAVRLRTEAISQPPDRALYGAFVRRKRASVREKIYVWSVIGALRTAFRTRSDSKPPFTPSLRPQRAATSTNSTRRIPSALSYHV